jgi:anthraniloyl-CoA monooxygenase
MEVVCIGAGPAGLYFAILTKLRDPSAAVTVLERNAEGETFGFGVTFSDDVLDTLHAADPVSAARIQSDPASWGNQVVVLDGQVGHMGGYGFAIGRHRMLRLLAERARELGVQLRYEQPVENLGDHPGADLVVAADGVNSRVRDADPGFGTEIDHGENYFLWLGARRFDEFTYGFESTPHGWLGFSAYPFDERTSTFIPECAPATWKGLGFDQLDTAAALKSLEQIFARHLAGVPLQAQAKPQDADKPASWARFRWVTNQTWYTSNGPHGNVVLIGDAAHTAHYSIGNGTKLALEDAVELDRQLGAHPGDVPAALAAYQSASVPRVAARQRIARASSRWFEELDATAGAAARDGADGAVRFAYDLRNAGTEPLPEPSGVSWALHRATQLPAGRWARGRLSSAKRRQQARESRSSR